MYVSLHHSAPSHFSFNPKLTSQSLNTNHPSTPLLEYLVTTWIKCDIRVMVRGKLYIKSVVIDSYIHSVYCRTLYRYIVIIRGLREEKPPKKIWWGWKTLLLLHSLNFSQNFWVTGIHVRPGEILTIYSFQFQSGQHCVDLFLLLRQVLGQPWDQQ